MDDQGIEIRRADRPGDLGWIVLAHGEMYAEQFGWDTTFEAMVARIVADFAAGHDPAREAVWIAARDGRRVGCIGCVAGEDDASAVLRILLVDPAVRGLGLGRHLADVCLAFARAAGYERITLWTVDACVSARRIYQAAGFELVGEQPIHSFGADLVGQSWARQL